MPILRPGQWVRDTYVVDCFLGEGAFSETYRVRHRFLGTQAMKVFKNTHMTLAEIEEMLGEALLLSRIGHPNIIRVFDANVAECPAGTLGFFTMEYVAGGTLADYGRSFGERPMPVGEAVGILEQVCAGVAVAHGEHPPIIHRDIKPQNILMGFEDAGLRVRVSDFGVARRVDPLTLMGDTHGTLAFKSPESLRGLDSCAGDVWALGTTLYLVLANTMPYPGVTDRDYADGGRFEQPYRRPSLYNIEVDSALDAILARCLAMEPGDRYPDAGALLRELARWEAGRAGAAAPAGRPLAGAAAGAGNPSAAADDGPAAARKAIALSREPGQLDAAADLLEEVLRKHPALRDRYAAHLDLWRRGICM